MSGILAESAENEANAPEVVTPEQVQVMQEAMESLQRNYSLVVENLADVQLMLDAQGWTPMFDYTTNGLTKLQLNTASRQLRELVVGSPLMKKGAGLRHGFIFGKGFEVDVSSIKTNMGKARVIQMAEKVFGPATLEQWTRADFTDGNFFMVGDNKTKKVSLVPVEQITGVYVDGDDREDVQAFRRSWIRFTGTKAENRNEWYYTDTYDGRRLTTIPNGEAVDATEGVDKNKTILWNPVNRQIGWTWGIPDALPAIAWSRLYRDFVENGYKMSEAMTRVAFTLTSKTRAGGTNAAAGMATGTGAGRTAAMSNGMNMSALSTAGKAYDFESGDSIAAFIASAIEVPLQDLLSKPDSDKADGVPGHVKRAMRIRQHLYGAFIKRVLVWLGAPATISIKWPEIDDMDVFRKSQMVTGAWGTGLYDPEEIRPALAEVGGIPLTKPTAPSGVLVPNNLETVKAGAQVTDTSGNASDKTVNQSGSDQKMDGSNSQKNGQGRDSVKNGTQSDGSNDLRDGTTKK